MVKLVNDNHIDFNDKCTNYSGSNVTRVVTNLLMMKLEVLDVARPSKVHIPVSSTKQQPSLDGELLML